MGTQLRLPISFCRYPGDSFHQDRYDSLDLSLLKLVDIVNLCDRYDSRALSTVTKLAIFVLTPNAVRKGWARWQFGLL
jgi:hypothetical protein